MVERYNIPTSEAQGHGHLYTYILMAYFLLAPFEDVLTFSTGTLGKWLAVLIVIVGLCEVKGRIKLRFKEGNLHLMYLMLLSLLSCLWAIDLNIALERNFAYLALPGFYLFVSSLDFSEKEYERIVRASVLGGVAVSAYLLLNGYITSSGRMQLDESNDPNNLAALLQLPAAMSFRQAMQKHTRGRLFYIIGLLMVVFMLLLTGSRGGMVSVAVFFLAFFLFSKAYKKAGILFGMLLIGFLIWRFVLPALPEWIASRLFETDYNNEIISGSRVQIWRTVFCELIPQMPAYGLGAGCAQYALEKWFGKVTGVHSAYFNMICEYGVLGIGAFLWVLFAKVKKQVKLAHHTEAALMLCIYVTIFFLDAYAKKFFWNVMLITAIAANADRYAKHNDVLRNESEVGYRKGRLQ